MNKKITLNLSTLEVKISDPPTPETPSVASTIEKPDTAGESYPGGKGGSGVYQTLINMIPPHEYYIETHLGHGAVMRHKRPAKRKNIGIDIDPDIISKWIVRTDIVKLGEYPTDFFINDDACAFLHKEFKPGAPYNNTFIYCDPPYLMETRKVGKLYKYEYTTKQHVELLTILKQLNCMVMISGYWSHLYADMLHGWNFKSFQAQTRGGVATEWIWYNYDDPTELHDYSYIGNNYRERERIKRKIGRWSKRLESLPVLERNAIMEKLTKGGMHD